MSNSKIALRIAEYAFAITAVYYGAFCWLTRYDTLVWLSDDSFYTTWQLRAGIGVTAAVLGVLCVIMEPVE